MDSYGFDWRKIQAGDINLLGYIRYCIVYGTDLNGFDWMRLVSIVTGSQGSIMQTITGRSRMVILGHTLVSFPSVLALASLLPERLVYFGPEFGHRDRQVTAVWAHSLRGISRSFSVNEISTATHLSSEHSRQFLWRW